MPLAASEKVGRYEILALIGKGGMGEVYKAHDPAAGRDVAVKVAHARFSDRFSREARAVAALNHPNICTLYDVGPDYLVMEYVEGPTLAERIERGPIPLAEALEIARQMAAALEEAHQNGIVHRDFKPANVKLKPNGAVKVLDFGLAKQSNPSREREGAVDAENSPTITVAATQAGMLLGTAGYMSPEQARGEPVDRRADVWAFGVVLFEMLAGRRLFEGKTTSDVLAAVIRDEPDLRRVPAKVRPLLRRCLEKDPRRRLRDIGDSMGIVESTPEVQPASSRLVWAFAAAATVFMAAFAALAFLHFREKPPETRAITTSINPPENTAFDFAAGMSPLALSPDGQRIVFKARAADGRTQLWIRPLDAATAQPLAGTENAFLPFWSPDSRSIGFFSGGKLKRLDLTGGLPLTLADAPNSRGGSWSTRDVIVFAQNVGPLQRVAAGGGTPMPVMATAHYPDSNRFPWFLPDGRHFLFETIGADGTPLVPRIGVLDSPQAATLQGPTSYGVVYASGYLLYLRENTLMAQPFDDKRLVTTGEAVPVADHLRSSFFNGGALAAFSVSHEGLLAYVQGASETQQLTWFDRGGKEMGTLGDPLDFGTVELSPDRKAVAFDRVGQVSDLWIYPLARGLPTRFTFSPAADQFPIWSPDGKSIVYRSNPKGPFDLYRKAADGTGNEELLYADGATKLPTGWSPDGRLLLFYRIDPKTRDDIWVLPLDNPSKPYPWLATPFNERFAKFSPDGRWVAYASDESGRYEIYVAAFPGPGGKRQISTGGGFDARWRADGREIFYAAPNGKLIAVEVTIKGGTIDVGAVSRLSVPVILRDDYAWDVSLDGERFLVTAPAEQKSAAPLTLVQNWTALLKKK
jgi:Tol biopolymer transport system component/predicted Ser/Thr protein kinase